MIHFIKKIYNFCFKQNQKYDFEKSDIFYAISLYILLIILNSFLLQFLDDRWGIPSHKIHSKFSKKSILEILFQGLLLVPLIEELGFRLYLRYTKLNLTISSTVLIYFFLTVFSGGKLYKVSYSMFIILGVSVILGIILYFIFDKKDSLLKHFWTKRLKYIIWFSILFFSIPHISNLDFENVVQFVFIPVLIFPQIILATLTAYIRINKGIIYSIILHAVFNLLPVLTGVLVKLNSI